MYEMKENIVEFIKDIENEANFNVSKCKCSICGKSCSNLIKYVSDLISIGDIKDEHILDIYCTSVLKILNDDKFVLNNNKLYCNECYEQYKNLNSISKSVLRPSKIEYYLNIAKEVSTRSTCLRRKYGAILVKNDSIIATGYNGSPRGTKNCIDLGECRRDRLNIPRGQNYEMCRAVHAEQNCIINASKDQMLDSQLYLYGSDYEGNIVENMNSCQICKKLIINSGIKTVICAKPNKEYEIIDVINWIVNDETLTDQYGY